MLTGPFFICFKLVSWTIKLIILMSLGKKIKKPGAAEKIDYPPKDKAQPQNA